MRVDKTIIVEANNNKEAIQQAILESGYEDKHLMGHEWEACQNKTAFFQYIMPGECCLIINFVSSDIPDTPFYRVETFYSD